jgi:RNA polymerase sigma-70 factor (ECF subfamily)
MQYIQALVGNSIRAHELAQETFIRAYEDLANFHPNEQFGNWIHRYAHAIVINGLKVEGKMKTGEAESFEEDFEPADSTAQLVGVQLVKDVWKNGDKLPLLYQDPLVLHFVCGKSIEDVSEILQLPVRIVESRIARGVSRLQKL